MTERIIFCLLSCVAALADLPHREVLRLDDGVVAAVPDETLMELFANAAPPSLLYFSPESYDDAIRGLTAEEIEEAVGKRRQAWAASPLGDATKWINGRLRACLTLAALVRQEAEGALAAAIDAHVDSGLALMSDLITQGLYDDGDPAVMLEFALEREARLMEELAAAQSAPEEGTLDLEPWKRESTLRTSQAEAISRALVALTGDQDAGVLPFIDLNRAYFITPADDGVMTTLRGGSLLFVSWKEGVVADWHARESDLFRSNGEAPKVLYLDVSDFFEDVMELTQAQLGLAFERRAAWGKEEWTRSWGEHLNGERLYLNLLKRAFRSQLEKSDAELASVLREQIAWEAAALMGELARFPTWVPPDEVSGRTHLRRLKDCEEDLQRDIHGLRALAQLRNDASLEARIGDIAARTQRRLAELAPVIE